MSVKVAKAKWLVNEWTNELTKKLQSVISYLEWQQDDQELMKYYILRGVIELNQSAACNLSIFITRP